MDPHDTTGRLDFDALVQAHADLHATATALAGRSLDGPKRAELYYAVHQDSAGNFMFPLIAAHGSLWGVSHTRRIERVLARFERLSRHGRIRRWIDALDAVRDVNRRVFIEIYTTFYFTRQHGRHPRAGEIIKPEVLALYNEVHDAVAAGVPLSRADRRRIYYDIFVHEQHDIVDPGIHDAAAATQSPRLVNTLKHVRPRFRYFPRGARLYFTDFTDVNQRNREGLRALDFAEHVGTARVREAMAEYP